MSGGGTGFGERLRLWLAAVLIDLGNWLSLDPAERRARRVWRRLEGRIARAFGRRVTLVLMGADFVAPPVAEGEEGEGAPGAPAARYLGMVVARRRSEPAGGSVELRCLVRCPAKGRRARGRSGEEEEEIALWQVARTPAGLGAKPGSSGGVISHFSRDHETALLNYYFDGFPRLEGASPPEEEPDAWAAVPEWAPGDPEALRNANSYERRKNVIRELETKEARRPDGGSPEDYAAQGEGDFGGPTAQELLLAEQFAAEIAAEAAGEGSEADLRFAELGLAGAYADEEDVWPSEAVFFGEAISALADESAEEEIEELLAS